MYVYSGVKCFELCNSPFLLMKERRRIILPRSHLGADWHVSSPSLCPYMNPADVLRKQHERFPRSSTRVDRKHLLRQNTLQTVGNLRLGKPQMVTIIAYDQICIWYQLLCFAGYFITAKIPKSESGLWSNVFNIFITCLYTRHIPFCACNLLICCVRFSKAIPNFL